MKKNFNTITVGLILCMVFSTWSQASMSNPSNDSSHDMLQGSDDGENENEDAASRWGVAGNKTRSQAIHIAQPVAAIDESSFEPTKNRAPASMRGPAAAKPVEAKKPLPSAKTMVRTMREKKAHQEAAVIVNDLGFFPSTLFVTQGIPVRLFVTGASQRSQCLIIDAYGIRRQVRSNKVEEVVFTPDQPGKFAYTCPMNGAKGTIIVKTLEFAERIPASDKTEEPVGESAQADLRNAESLISDSDFGVEFRTKH
jgi:plastocyanin